MAGCASQDRGGWQTHDVGPFTFALPPGFHKTSLHGIDSNVSGFDGPGMSFDFDYGMYSGFPLDSLQRNPYSLGPSLSYVSHMEHIAGHEVQIVSCDAGPSHNAGFPYFIEASFLRAGLSMSARCETTNDCETAAKIFRTVKFK